uniref:Uncharacterized protein n=1 Tax=Timema poppense TaxID=170557 RepID=A0A7R9H073_TIMPO|nr:unnamed protein product [Timema poppensis]
MDFIQRLESDQPGVDIAAALGLLATTIRTRGKNAIKIKCKEVVDAEIEEIGNEELQELAQNPSSESDSEEDKLSCTFTMKSMATAFHLIQGRLQMLADEDPDVKCSARMHRTVMEGLTCYQEIYKEKKTCL